jgi:aminoglycoside phosphotransferase family enzyme/predicted kinase
MAGEQDEVYAFLSRPETFGADRVERIETHASIVFLAGAEAYKLKKAVRYSYLDYSTQQKRRAACEAELAINRRFAPRLYLRVEPVLRAADGALRRGFGKDGEHGEGEAVDWLLVMRRFDQDDRLDHMAERGALNPAIMIALADRIAALHAAAEPRRDFGGASGFRPAIEGALENLRVAVPQGLPEKEVEAWGEAAFAALERQAGLLDRRRAAGKVRACHGDLHLQNICLVEGVPTLFDAIEFDPAIYTIDVLYDLAFLLMDLHRRGLDRYGNLVFNRYLDRCDETDGLAALPLFIAVRAAIRAQVTAAAAAHRHDGGDPAEAMEQAARYLDLARASLAPEPPRLLCVGGVSGTGKSTLAFRLAPSLGAAPGARLLRSDVLRKRLAGVAEAERLPAKFYTAAAHEAVYARLEQEARRCLAGGRAVVIDAVCGAKAERARFVALAREMGVPFDGLWLTAPPEQLAARIRARKSDASDATVEVLHRQLATVEPPEEWRRIDAGRAPEAMEKAALAALGVGAAERRSD